MAFDPNDPALRDATDRKGEFREIAREIVWKDRQNRKYGSTVDTGGAITRAMEQAYKLGLAHGAKELPPSIPIPPDPDAPLLWNSIPPKPRGIYEQILSFGWTVVFEKDNNPWSPRPRNKWACYWVSSNKESEEKHVQFADVFSVTTLAPIIKLGLMKEHIIDKEVYLVQTPKGIATWQRAIEDGHVIVRHKGD